ncbi:hypothetical protein HYC85_028445, partial [Camellia sinensis]
ARKRHGPTPSRTLLVRNINSNIEDSELRVLFEDNPLEKDINQGTSVVSNLDYSVSNNDLHQIFGIYREIQEIHETPHKFHLKFIEFYDVRAAEAAHCALNKCNIAGKQINLGPSSPGGARQWFWLLCSSKAFCARASLGYLLLFRSSEGYCARARIEISQVSFLDAAFARARTFALEGDTCYLFLRSSENSCTRPCVCVGGRPEALHCALQWRFLRSSEATC